MVDQHTKIRLKKQKSKWWREFPSAQQDSSIQIKTKRSKAVMRRLIKKTFLYVSSVILCLLLIIFITFKIGISGQFIKDKMQVVVSNQILPFTDVKISDAKISINNTFDFVIEVDDLNLMQSPKGIQLDKIGSLKLSLSTWQLLNGKIELKNIEFADANIVINNSNSEFNLWAMLPKTDNGQLDIDQLQMLLFKGSDTILAKFDEQAIKQFIIRDVVVNLPSKTEEDKKNLIIDKIVAENDNSNFKINASIEYENKSTNVDTLILRDKQSKANTIKVKVNNFATHLGASDEAPAFFSDGRLNAMLFRLKGITNLNFTSQKKNETTQKPLTKLTMALNDGNVDIADQENLPANINIDLEYQGDQHSISILPSEVNIGDLFLPFSGIIETVRNDNDKSITNNLFFKIISNDGKISNEKIISDNLTLNSKLTGYFDIDAKELVFDDLNIVIPSGILSAQGDMVFGQGTPAINFNLKTDEIALNDAKMLWPINLAPGGRRWVSAHLFNGKIKNGSIRVSIPQDFFVGGKPIRPLSVNEVEIKSYVENAEADTYGELPRLTQGTGFVKVEGQNTTILLESGLSTLPNKREVKVNKGELVIPWGIQRPVYAELKLSLSTDIKTAGDVLHLKPVAVADRLPFNPEKAVGDIVADVDVKFPITRDNPPGVITWKSDVNFNNFSLSEPIEGMLVKDANGIAHITKEGAVINGKGLLNEYPATVTLVHPFENSLLKKQETIVFSLDDKIRQKYLPFLNMFINGLINVNVGEEVNKFRHIQVDLTNVPISFPWVNWEKGKGIAAKVEFDIPSNFNKLNNYTIQNFILRGNNFNVAGDITIENKQFKHANFKKANLNRGDDISVSITQNKNAYQIKVDGNAYDARSLIKNMGKAGNNSSNDNSINLIANIKTVTGFNDETLFNVTASYALKARDSSLTLTALTGANLPMSIATGANQNQQYLDADSADAGVLLRFVNYYDKLHSGNLMARLSTNSKNEPLSGPVKIKNFLIVDEKKLEVLVANTPSNRGPNPKDPNIISSRIPFDVAFVKLGKGENYLVVDNGILRGPAVGASFQGVIYDSAGNMNLTGTFMPAYGVNTLVSELPLIGKVLGNGRDKGLIGITFKLIGNVKAPDVIVNPVSAIAPGILRQIFEFQ